MGGEAHEPLEIGVQRLLREQDPAERDERLRELVVLKTFHHQTSELRPRMLKVLTATRGACDETQDDGLTAVRVRR
jgi:hypothetical protein